MYRYAKENAAIIRESDGAFIPLDVGNADYLTVQAWLAEDQANAVSPYLVPLEDYLAQVNRLREKRVNAGVEWNGIPFDSDEVSRANLAGIVAAIGAGVPLPDGFAWRNAANVDVPMTAAEVVAFAATMIAHVNACYAASWALKDQLEQAPDPASVDLSIGWPE